MLFPVHAGARSDTNTAFNLPRYRLVHLLLLAKAAALCEWRDCSSTAHGVEENENAKMEMLDQMWGTGGPIFELGASRFKIDRRLEYF